MLLSPLVLVLSCITHWVWLILAKASFYVMVSHLSTSNDAINNHNRGCIGGTNCSTMLLQYNFFNTEQSEKVFIKRFLKRNLPDVGMAQWMHWLTKYTNKKCHAHSDGHIIHQLAISISSSGMPIGTKFTATYVEMVVEVPCQTIELL